VTDFDVALARKQFARSLRILVIVQVVGLCMAIPGALLQVFPFLLFGADSLAMFTAVGVCLWMGGAMAGCWVIWHSKIMPRRIHLYGKFGGMSMMIFCIFIPLSQMGFVIPFFVVMFFAYVWFVLLFLGCGFIIQFYIARWLAKEAKDGTIEPDWGEKTRSL